MTSKAKYVKDIAQRNKSTDNVIKLHFEEEQAAVFSDVVLINPSVPSPTILPAPDSRQTLNKWLVSTVEFFSSLKAR